MEDDALRMEIIVRGELNDATLFDLDMSYRVPNCSSLLDGSSGRIIKSCFGLRVFRLSASVSSREAPGMLERRRAFKARARAV